MNFNERYSKIEKTLFYIAKSHLLNFSTFDLAILTHHLYLLGYDNTVKDIQPILTIDNKEKNLCESEP